MKEIEVAEERLKFAIDNYPIGTEFINFAGSKRKVVGPPDMYNFGGNIEVAAECPKGSRYYPDIFNKKNGWAKILSTNNKPENNYTVLNDINPFFKKGERTNLDELKRYFSVEGVARLVLNEYLYRDFIPVTKMIHLASDDLIDWVEVEYISKVGDKFNVKILANNYSCTFKFVKPKE